MRFCTFLILDSLRQFWCSDEQWVAGQLIMFAWIWTILLCSSKVPVSRSWCGLILVAVSRIVQRMKRYLKRVPWLFSRTWILSAISWYRSIFLRIHTLWEILFRLYHTVRNAAVGLQLLILVIVCLDSSVVPNLIPCITQISTHDWEITRRESPQELRWLQTIFWFFAELNRFSHSNLTGLLFLYRVAVLMDWRLRLPTILHVNFIWIAFSLILIAWCMPNYSVYGRRYSLVKRHFE